MAFRRSFYSFTNEFSQRVGDIGSFIWASYAGLWHLREQALDYGATSSTPEWQRISERVVGEAPGAGGVDLQPLVTSPWQRSEEFFCDLILSQGAIAFEEWSAELAKMCQVGGLKVKAESFQFPSGSTGKATNWAVLETHGVLPSSPFLEFQIRPFLLSEFASNINQIDQLLLWYRHFKELRNTVAHHGSVARVANEEAYDAAIVTPLKDLGIRRDYVSPRPVAGCRISITVADATLFLAIIQRAAYAFDAKFCHTLGAEMHLSDRVRQALLKARPPGAATKEKKRKWITAFLRRGVHVRATSVEEVEKWLSSKNLLKIKTQLI